MARGKDVTRSRLLAVATEVLGEHGFGSTTVDDIAERAGVAKGTVYYHFESKVGLVEVLINEGLQPLADRMRDVVAGSVSARAALEALTRAELEFIRDNRQFAKLVVTELWREDRVWRRTLMVIRDSIVTSFSEQIQRGIDTGELRADLDPRFAGGALFSLTATAALDWLALEPQRPIEEVLEQLRRLTAIASIDSQKSWT